MMKRTISFIFAILFIAACVPSSSAYTRASRQLDMYNLFVTDEGKGVVKISAYVLGTRFDMIKIGFPTIILFEVNNGEADPVKIVTAQYSYNADSHSYSATYQGTVGKEYYAYASIIAQDKEGSDGRTLYSPPIITK